MSRLSLRARLLLGVLVLTTVGLVLADTVTYTSLRSFLIQRVDAGLEADHEGAERAGIPGGGGPGGGPQGFGAGGTGQDFGEIRAPDGTVVSISQPSSPFQVSAPPGPDLPATISIPAQPNDGPDRTTYFTVPAVSGSGSWRVRASIDPGQNDTLILATSLSGVTGTLHRLFEIELLVTVAVLAGVAALGLWIVRLGLRPLAEITATAQQITEGELSHRVGTAGPRTEVGKLGLALNTMLDRIEESDSRLRRFVADASHELRTPLAAVRAYAELFARGADKRPDDLARAMGGISRESERMSALVDDLLLLARLDEGRPLTREAFALDELAREAVETARAVDPQRPVSFEASTPMPLTIIGDRRAAAPGARQPAQQTRAHTRRPPPRPGCT